jgi:hypothetical protein
MYSESAADQRPVVVRREVQVRVVVHVPTVPVFGQESPVAFVPTFGQQRLPSA